MAVHAIRVGFALALTALVGAARADRALVIGIDKYTYLKPAESLEGCLRDATSIKAVLTAKGFLVDVLPNATRVEILSKFAEYVKTVNSDERFVLFFAGHGVRSQDGEALLVPSDSKTELESNNISARLLYQLVASIHAKSRSVLLDSCFSEGIARAKSPRLRGRSLTPSANRPASHAADNQHLSTHDDVCYFAASRADEEASEFADDDGKVQGCFTQSLVRWLKTNVRTWQELESHVCGDVAKVTGDLQHPTVSPSYRDTEIFGVHGQAVPASAPVIATLWDYLQIDHMEKPAVELTVSPNRTLFDVGVSFFFNVSAGTPGYLVVFQRDSDKSPYLNLLYPESGQLIDCRVDAGQAVRIPSEGQYEFLAPGDQRIKAILLADPQEAEKLLSAFRSTPLRFGFHSMTIEQASTTTLPQGKQLISIWTSDILFEVRDKGRCDITKWRHYKTKPVGIPATPPPAAARTLSVASSAGLVGCKRFADSTLSPYARYRGLVR